MKIECINCDAEWQQDSDGETVVKARCLDCGALFYATRTGKTRYSQRVWWMNTALRTFLALGMSGIGFAFISTGDMWGVLAVVLGLLMARSVSRDWREAASYIGGTHED